MKIHSLKEKLSKYQEDQKFKKKENKFYSTKDNDNESEGVEILFIGTSNLEEESEVEIEAQYMAVVDEIEKCRKRNKVFKEKLSRYQEEKIKLLWT